jgi:branched-chain amino acid aminotransferase
MIPYIIEFTLGDRRMVQKLSKVWMDGKLILREEANVRILTHSVHYGLAVFKGNRCYL